jgi:hypothetical protein
MGLAPEVEIPEPSKHRHILITESTYNTDSCRLDLACELRDRVRPECAALPREASLQERHHECGRTCEAALERDLARPLDSTGRPEGTHLREYGAGEIEGVSPELEVV